MNRRLRRKKVAFGGGLIAVVAWLAGPADAPAESPAPCATFACLAAEAPGLQVPPAGVDLGRLLVHAPR